MIPYFNLPIPKLGPIEIHAFGVLVATGILLGSNRVRFRGRQLGLSDEDTSSLSTWVVVGGFIVAHLFDVIAYQPGELVRDPLVLLKVWRGISSFGGFLGALFAMLIWSRFELPELGPGRGVIGFVVSVFTTLTRGRRRAVPVPLLPLSDSLLYGLATGWFFGRLGCFTAHDHPGEFTSFFLGVNYPEGVRHDLGLYEALFTGALVVLFAILARRPRPTGLYAALACLLYGPARFALDFLRITDGAAADPRYFGLTPAQYGSVAVTLVGVVLAIRVARSSPGTAAAQDQAAPTPTSSQI